MSSQQLAPARCPACGQANEVFEQTCKACGGPLTAWQSLPPEVLNRYRCWRCGGMYTRLTTSPQQGTGCLLVAIGIIFAPVLIGIIIIIYGVSLMNESQTTWQCRSCGLTLPG